MNQSQEKYSTLNKILKERERKFSTEAKSTSDISKRHHLKHGDLVIFTRQLATMVEARMPLASSLEMLAQYSKGEKVTQLIQDIATRVNEGDSLAVSLSNYPGIFNSLYINMVEVGETAGILDVTLDRLANHLEKMMSLKRKIISALSYPAIILVVAVGAISFLLTAIVPTFAELFHDFGAELPGPTRLIIHTADLLKQHGFTLILVIILLAYLLFKATGKGKGKMVKDELMLKIPLFGAILKNSIIARFCRTLATLLESGVTLVGALNIIHRTAENSIFKDVVDGMRARILKGGYVADTNDNMAIFPPIVSRMIAVGEETAALDKMLHKVADFYDEEIDAIIDTLTSVIEPVIIVLLSVVLGGTLIAMYMQIFNLMEVIK